MQTAPFVDLGVHHKPLALAGLPVGHAAVTLYPRHAAAIRLAA